MTILGLCLIHLQKCDFIIKVLVPPSSLLAAAPAAATASVSRPRHHVGPASTGLYRGEKTTPSAPWVGFDWAQLWEKLDSCKAQPRKQLSLTLFSAGSNSHKFKPDGREQLGGRE